ncbi:speckle-type POZ protein-like [Protopterus annectens]|uniref:speckle-type POZ protein-like n=1 Tax=Protopterus annectens TaxID=7888 RepID=UPI001CF9D737|nr:speckle-type POZ protein-like [Protopterus annectens]
MASEPMENRLCQNQNEAVAFCTTWTISNFSFSHEVGKFIKSSYFSSGAQDRWYLRMRPCETDERYGEEYVSIFLCLQKSPNPEVMAEFKFSVLNANGEETLVTVTEKPYQFKNSTAFGFKKFVKRDFLLDDTNELLQDDTLTIFCEVRIKEDFVNTSDKNTRDNESEIQLTKDLQGLLENSWYTDCSLCVAGAEFQAHKAVLAARCPAFRAMFERHMAEEKKNHFEITEVKPEIFKEILHFIYTGRAPNLNNMGYDLLAAAEKFELERLKLMCENTLCRKMSVETVAEILVFADRQRRNLLKAQALDFIIYNINDIMETSGWESLMMYHPHLAREAFSSMVSRESVFVEPPSKKRKTF